MTTTHHAKPIQPIVCAPWCATGDGHPNEHSPEDQTCWGAGSYVALSRETADVDLDGNPYPARVGAMAHRPYNETPVVYLHAELHGFKQSDTAAHLTAQEARALAAALTSAADEIEGPAGIPNDDLIDELVRRLGADEVCREFNVASIEQLRTLIRH